MLCYRIVTAWFWGCCPARSACSAGPAVVKWASWSDVTARKRTASAVRAFRFFGGWEKPFFWRRCTWPAPDPAGRAASGPGGPSRGRRGRGNLQLPHRRRTRPFRVYADARTRASAKPVPVSRAAVSARASTCKTKHGHRSPLGTPRCSRRFFSADAFLPRAAERAGPSSRIDDDGAEPVNSKSSPVNSNGLRARRIHADALRRQLHGALRHAGRRPRSRPEAARGARRVGRIFGDRHGRPRRGGVRGAADRPARGGGPARRRRGRHSEALDAAPRAPSP